MKRSCPKAKSLIPPLYQQMSLWIKLKITQNVKLIVLRQGTPYSSDFN